MKPFKGYDSVQPYKTAEKLPAGGYVLKILEAREMKYEWGSVLLISFDIAEGEHKDFFANNYKSQQGEDKKWKGTYRLNVPKDDGSEADQWKQRRFKTVINAIEDSNKGYFWDWDEAKLKGKTVGALFNNKEYEFNGRNGFFTNCHSLVEADVIREGRFTIPADTLLKRDSAAVPYGNYDDFMNIPDDIQEELPFN